MQDLNDLYFFAQVVDHQGFAPAGRALGMPKSTLSRRIALLEEQLGVRLIQRSTRRFSVTEMGQRYYSHCKAMLIEAEAAQQAIDLNRSEPQGIVRLTCPVGILHARIGAMLGDFLAATPRVTVHLEATNRVVDVIGEGVDVAIRVRPPPLKDSDLVMKVLGERGWCLVASPALLHQHGVPGGPEVPADLASLPSLDFGPAPGEHVWELDGPDGQVAAIHHTPRFVTDDMLALKQAAAAGAGIVQLPLMVVSDELKRGTLVHIVPAWNPRSGIIHAVFPSRRGLLPSVRSLIDFLAQRFQEIDES
ncbi:HTH-type transcriptional regulator DmlR [Paraburkholderia caffeinitolerans]|uniref:HTH-type transcriptional regulator DmlR n=1 Tax=Paraburkholderia caffeinitolerans TaxID=1723730 RepID=A0A6J5GLS6_9BURK|nr:LysR family transcriptional regulator [Paraburkholderia caffeinitolerans]CAB3801445.1 HTH-type transcriptional regulator DmlR [Paraburkholderia caffeinitolerans]